MSGRIYDLLPAIYRIRDAARGEPLRALLAALEQQFDAVDADIAQLYNDWFIETCQEWMVPYIGDLLGVRPLNPVTSATYSQRAYVANTLDYRRRKGTASMLEQMAGDLTGWPARVVEYFRLIATTQNVNHVRLENVRTPDLRNPDLLSAPHTAGLRGQYNIPDIGIFLGACSPTPSSAVPPARWPTRRTAATPSRRWGSIPQSLRWTSSSMAPRSIPRPAISKPGASRALPRPLLTWSAVASLCARASAPRLWKSATATSSVATWGVDPTIILEPVSDAGFQIAVTSTLADAVNQWKTQPAGTVGVITFPDSHTYTGNLTIPVSDGSRLVIVSAPGQRPHIRGDITFSGRGSAVLNGLLIEGKLDGTVGALRIAHSTVTGDISTAAASVTIDRSICGALKLTAEELEITESIVASVDAPVADAAVESATFFGPVSVRSLEASNSIFTAEVDCVRRQVGCMRFCCLPPLRPRPRAQYRCESDVAATFAFHRVWPPRTRATEPHLPGRHTHPRRGRQRNGRLEFFEATAARSQSPRQPR